MERQQSQKEKSLAWFKLAELIARGEREKALNVFRLLSHSLQDRAYVLQIEGDILWFLDDDKSSSEKYKQAAFLYQKEKRWIDALSIYEHLLTQNPESADVISTLLMLYAIVDWPEKFKERSHNLIVLFKNHAIDEAYLERVLRDIFEVVQISNDRYHKQWIKEWFHEALSLLPEGMRDRWSRFQ